MRCKSCGCDEDNPCEGGCFWVAPEICSACVVGDLFRRTIRLPPEAQVAIIQGLGEALDRVEEDLELHAVAADPAQPRLWRPGDPL